MFDGVGLSTFERGLDALRPRGTMALFGGASGPVTPLDPIVLAEKGPLFLTRPTLADYVRDRGELLKRSSDLFSWVEDGTISVTVDRSFELPRAGLTHSYLEERRTHGKVLLIPPQSA